MLPEIFQEWFHRRTWQLRSHQAEMLEAYHTYTSTLLLAPTGAGKTLAGFLPVLIDLYQRPDFKGLHTLYISPLKSLTNDIARNLQSPITEMNLPITVECRTGDTSGHQRVRQKKNPPHILLTTPESLALLLTYPDAAVLFKNLKTVIIDEIHTLAVNKRGDQTSLLLTRLQNLAPEMRRTGLSATVAHPIAMTQWLGHANDPAHLIRLASETLPVVTILYSPAPLPLAGHYPSALLVTEIYKVICAHECTLVFVNTRAQAERLFQDIWGINEKNLAIGIHHGSLTREQRLKIEQAMVEQKLKAVIATSSLDLGIDWGNVDAIVNVGAPKGISRLMQRIGRSNHCLDVPSRAILVPTNCFEALECQAALQAITDQVLDDDPPNRTGSLDVLAQHIMSCACASPVEKECLFHEITGAYPYAGLIRSTFDDTFNYVVNGGYVLQHYERYHRLIINEAGLYEPGTAFIKQRHRMNIGTIVESEKLKIMLISTTSAGRRRRGKGVHLGNVEERLILGMEPGDTFLFAGQVLRYENMRELIVEVTPSTSKQAKIPAFAGGRMPLSSRLAQGVRQLLETPDEHGKFPPYIQEWLEAQKNLSALPSTSAFVVEVFARQGLHYLTAYTFQGRPTNQTLGFVMSHRLEIANCQPLGFAISDYGLSLWCLSPIPKGELELLWQPELSRSDIEDWLQRSAMLKRSFRTTAIISGLIERKLPGHLKTGKQVTFSTDLIYDVLCKYDPHHLLLRSNRQDVDRELIDLERLKNFLTGIQKKIIYKQCSRITPFAIPLVVESLTESVNGTGTDALLALHNIQEKAAFLYQEALNE